MIIYAVVIATALIYAGYRIMRRTAEILRERGQMSYVAGDIGKSGWLILLAASAISVGLLALAFLVIVAGLICATT